MSRSSDPFSQEETIVSLLMMLLRPWRVSTHPFAFLSLLDRLELALVWPAMLMYRTEHSGWPRPSTKQHATTAVPEIETVSLMQPPKTNAYWFVDEENWLVFRDILSPVKYNDGWTMSPDFKELRKLVKLKFILTHRGKKDGMETTNSFSLEV